MNRVLAFLVRRHRIGSLGALLVLLAGAIAMSGMRRELFPHIDLRQIDVRAAYPGAAPEDVELAVTNKLEDALKGVAGIRRFVSNSFEGRCEITVDLDPDHRDPESVKRRIRDAVGSVRDLPPEVVPTIEIEELSTELVPIMEIAVAGDMPYRDLRALALELDELVRTVPGVSRIRRAGWRARELQVNVSPRALERTQLPLESVVAAIQEAAVRGSAGALGPPTKQLSVLTAYDVAHAAQVGGLVVRGAFDGPLVRVRDVATVAEGFEDATLAARANGVPAISLMVYKKESADTVRTSNAIKQTIRRRAAELSSSSPAEPSPTTQSLAGPLGSWITGLFGPQLDSEREIAYRCARVIYTQETAPVVRSRFRMVLTNGLMGLALVLVVLSLALEMRSAFWVAAGIPVAVLGASAALAATGRSLDSVSLTAMVLMTGMVVDDGIIFAEAIASARSRGLAPREAAVAGVQANFLAVLATVTTTVAAFLPFWSLGGLVGQFVATVPLIVAACLFVSLAEATVALPAHLARGMERRAAARGGAAPRDRFLRPRRAFAAFQRSLLAFRYPLVALLAAAVGWAAWHASARMRFVLFPTAGADRFFINIDLPMGSSLEASSEKVKEIERLVMGLPPGEVVNTLTTIGRAGYPPYGQAGNYATIAVQLAPYSSRSRSADRIIDELRSRTDRLPGYERISYQVDAGGPPVGRPIALKVIGHDDRLRRALAATLAERLAAIPGVKDIASDEVRGKDRLVIQPDPERAARLGVTVGDIARTARLAYSGAVAVTLHQPGENVDVRVRLHPEAREDRRLLGSLRVPNREGRLVRLADVAQLLERTGPEAYRHHNGKRAITVTADLDSSVTDASRVVARVLSGLDLARDWPGIEVLVEGEAEESAFALEGLAGAFGLAIVGIYFLLVLQLDSFGKPLIVLATIPFGLAAVVVTLVVHGESLGFLAMVGGIGLAGVVVNDAIVLVSHLNELRKSRPGAGAAELRALVAEGTADRLRAVLLTTVTTTAGMIPLAYGLGGYDLYMAPMALALGYGLLFATPTTLFLVPALYLIAADIERLARGRRRARIQQGVQS